MMRRIIFWTILVAVLALVGSYVRNGLIRAQYLELREIARGIEAFMHAHEGCFPDSEQALEAKGFLRKTKTGDTTQYEISRAPGSDSPRWSTVRLEKYRILYGADPSHFAVIDGKLCDKRTKHRVYLIDGPNRKALRGRIEGPMSDYEDISVRLFNEMRKRSDQSETQAVPSP